MKSTMLLFAALATAFSLPAQTQKHQPQGLVPESHQTDSALTAQTRKVFEAVTENIMKSAHEMPADKYTYRPGNGARTFGELIAHIANVQNTLCGNINGHAARKAGNPASKDSVIEELGHSEQECETAFSELSAENVNVPVATPVGQLTHLTALFYIVTHASEEYGQLAIYLRLNQLEPPTNDQVHGSL